MMNRRERDAQRRQFIREKIKENLDLVINDSESLFASDANIENN